MTRKWNDEQLKVLTEDGNILVSASAGSGKTTVMVEKIFNRLLKGASVEKVIVISYTNASAADMRSKITDRLFRALSESNYSDEQKAMLRSQIDDIPFSSVGTVDSFCAHLISENFDSAGVSPSYRQLDGDEAKVLFRAAFDEVCDRCHQSGDADFLELSERVNSPVSSDDLFGIVDTLYNAIYVNPNPAEFLSMARRNAAAKLCGSVYEKSICGYFNNYGASLVRACERYFKDLMGTPDAAAMLNDLKNAAVQLNKADNIRKLLDFSQTKVTVTAGRLEKAIGDDFLSDRVKYILKEITDCQKTIIKYLQDTPEYDDDAKRFVLKLIDLTESVNDEYKTQKSRGNMLDFFDLSHHALKLLGEGGRAAEIAASVDFVFVDEYQDINPLHEAIISQLSKGDNLFMVGDIKQGIYGFRNADSTILTSKYNEYTKDKTKGKALRLTVNYRSNKPVLNFADELFGNIITSDFFGFDYKKASTFLGSAEAVDAMSDDRKSGAMPQINIYYPEQEDEKEAASGLYSVKNHPDKNAQKMSASFIEGLGIAREIKSIVGKENIIVDGQSRRLEYSDVAVLLRSRSPKSMEMLDALKRCGVPTALINFENKGLSNDVKQLVTVMRAVDNSADDVVFTGYLLSFFGGLNNDDIAAIRLSATASEKDCSFYMLTKTAARGEGVLAKKCLIALEKLDDYRLRAAFTSASDLLREIMAENGFDAYLLSRPQGKTQYGTALSFLSAAESNSQSGSVQEFINFSKRTESMSFGGDHSFDNAVKVMTMHQSKGLEFPVVFIAAADTAFQGSRGAVLCDKNLGIGMQIFNSETRGRRMSAAYAAIKLNKKFTEQLESIRLLYVAVTRAQKRLYITAAAAKEVNAQKFLNAPSTLFGCSSFMDLIAYSKSLSFKCAAVKLLPQSPLSSTEYMAVSTAFNKTDEKYIDIIGNILNYKYKYTQARPLSPKYTVTQINRQREGVPEIAPVTFSESARLRGVAYHSVMQNISFDLKSAADVKDEIEFMVESGKIEKSEADMVNPADIFRCISSDVIQNARGLKTEREYEFMLSLPANEVLDTASTDKILIQGVIDLLIWQDGQAVLVDYKSGIPEDTKLMENYKNQLKLYELAVKTAFKAEVTKKYLYSFKNGRFFEV